MSSKKVSPSALNQSNLLSLVGGGSPLQVEVILTDSNMVQSLRQQLTQLQAEHDRLRDSFAHTEYKYRCEVLVNMQIMDYCKDKGIKIPRRLLRVAEESEK